MSPELKNFLNKHITYIENEEIDKLICQEVIEKKLLDELLDFLYDCGAPLSTGVVTDQLIKYYVLNNPMLTAKKKEALQLKICYLINKYQATLVSAIIEELA